MRDMVFQGGGQYDAKGQEIHARIEDDGTMLFYDASRMIPGEIKAKLAEWPVGGEAAVQSWIIAAYINNRYVNSRRADEFAWSLKK